MTNLRLTMLRFLPVMGLQKCSIRLIRTVLTTLEHLSIFAVAAKRNSCQQYNPDEKLTMRASAGVLLQTANRMTSLRDGKAMKGTALRLKLRPPPTHLLPRSYSSSPRPCTPYMYALLACALPLTGDFRATVCNKYL